MIKPEHRCLRCKRPLHSQQSIERGYGKACWKAKEGNGDIEKLKLDMNFLKTLFRGVKNIKSGTVYQDDPIERIKKEEENKIIDDYSRGYRDAYTEVISELKVVLEERKKKLED